VPTRLGVACALAAAILALGPAGAVEPENAADETPAPPERDVAAEFTDPLTTLPQLFLQDSLALESYGTEAISNRLTARLAVPRLPSSSLIPLDQLIRPSVSLVTVPTGRGDETRTELGDTVLLDLAVLPLESRRRGLVVALGPVLVFPTATHRTAGQGAWQLGPALGAIYKGRPGLLVGFLLQNPISFATTSSSRESVNALLFQPVLMAYLGRGFYLKSGDSTWSLSWRDDGPRVVPVSLGLGYVWRREGKPPLNLYASGEWMLLREDAPVAPQFSLKLGVSISFPEWKLH
jgi:hypothetical protein